MFRSTKKLLWQVNSYYQALICSNWYNSGKSCWNMALWFISILFWLLGLSGPEAGMLHVASSPSGCCMENPLRAQFSILEMDDSSQMWSIKSSVLVFVYIKSPSCLMSQNPDKLATSSSELSCLHTLGHVRNHVRSGCIVNRWSRKKLPDSRFPKMWHGGWITKWHVLSSPHLLTSPVKSAPHCKYCGALTHSTSIKAGDFCFECCNYPTRKV